MKEIILNNFMIKIPFLQSLNNNPMLKNTQATAETPRTEKQVGDLKKKWSTPSFEKIEVAFRSLWLLQPGPGPGGPPSGPTS